MSRRQNCYNLYYRGGFDGWRRPPRRNRRKTSDEREGEKKRRIKKKQHKDNEPIGRCQTEGTPSGLSHAPGGCA